MNKIHQFTKTDWRMMVLVYEVFSLKHDVVYFGLVRESISQGFLL